jgi:hypothetical protein
VATAAAVLALVGAISGAVAVARAGKRPASIAIAAGSAGLVVGFYVIVTADGGPGTGNGIVGGFAAVAFGLGAVILGGLARRRLSAD